MSTAHGPNASAPTPPAEVSLFRRLLFPFLIVVICGLFFFTPRIWAAFVPDAELEIPVLMLSMMALPLGILLLLGWLMFFSGLWWRTRFLFLLAGLAWGAGMWAALYFMTRDVEFTTKQHGMIPVFHFVWERTPQDEYSDFYKKELANSEGLPEIDATVGPQDFASYRGLNLAGVVPHAKLQTDWKQHPPQLVWKHPCVEGYSGIAVAGNIAVTLEHRDGKEAVVCYDRATGRQRWFHAYDAYYKDGMRMGDGPRSTPTIHDGRIFTIGATGEMLCLDVAGKLQWQLNILKDSQAKNITWGLTCSPLIVGDLVIANPGVDPSIRAGASLVAFEQATGKKRWAVGNRKASYSSPQLATFAGVQQIILFDGEGLVSYEPATQKELWQLPWETKMDMNMMQPVVLSGDRVFISSEKENGCAMLKIKAPDEQNPAWRVETLWKNLNLGARFANPVTDGKRVFGLHGVIGILTCLDVQTGKHVWRYRDEAFGPGQLLLAGDTLLVVGEEGVASLFDTESAEPRKLSQFQALDRDRKTWNTPALAGDQLFLRNQKEIACFKLAGR